MRRQAGVELRPVGVLQDVHDVRSADTRRIVEPGVGCGYCIRGCPFDIPRLSPIDHKVYKCSQLPEAIDLMVRGLKSGLPVTESIGTVAREMQQPLATEFRRVTDGVRFGRGLEEVMWEAARRLDIPEFNFFVISLSIQRETGGNLAETLTNLSDILRRRRQMRQKIKAMSSEAKASAYILGSLPFAMFGIVYCVNPGYASMLFTDPRGLFMLGGGLVSLGIAVLVIVKLIRFEI